MTEQDASTEPEKKTAAGGRVEALVMPLGMKKTPLGWPQMAHAYIDFALWAIGEEGFIDAFESDTGVEYIPPTNGLEEMIDEATGFDRTMISEFLDWLTANHWGEA